MIDPKITAHIEQKSTEIFNNNIAKALNERERYNEVNLSPIPSHAHTGADSQQVEPENLVNSQLYFAVQTTMLSSTQIKLLRTTPQVIVPAVGSGTTATNLNSVIIVEGITAKNLYSGTAFTGANALEFRYTDGAGTKVTADMPNTFINNAGNTFNHVAGITTVFTPVVNAPIVVAVPTANPGAGNGSIIFVVKYRVITL